MENLVDLLVVAVGTTVGFLVANIAMGVYVARRAKAAREEGLKKLIEAQAFIERKYGSLMEDSPDERADAEDAS